MHCQSKQCLMDIQSETKPNSLRQIGPSMQKNNSKLSLLWSARPTCGREMGKCAGLIPSHSHQAIPIPIPMKLA